MLARLVFLFTVISKNAVDLIDIRKARPESYLSSYPFQLHLQGHVTKFDFEDDTKNIVYLQLKGLSPVCLRLCRVNSSERANLASRKT